MLDELRAERPVVGRHAAATGAAAFARTAAYDAEIVAWLDGDAPPVAMHCPTR